MIRQPGTPKKSEQQLTQTISTLNKELNITKKELFSVYDKLKAAERKLEQYESTKSNSSEIIEKLSLIITKLCEKLGYKEEAIEELNNDAVINGRTEANETTDLDEVPVTELVPDEWKDDMLNVLNKF